MSFTTVSLAGVSLPPAILPPLASGCCEMIDAASEARIRSVMHTSLEGVSATDMPYAMTFLQKDILELREEIKALQVKITYVEKESAQAFVRAAALIDDLRARLESCLKENKILHKETQLRKDLARLALWELTRFSGAKMVEVDGAVGSGGVQRLVFLNARSWRRALGLIHTSSGAETSASGKCKVE